MAGVLSGTEELSVDANSLLNELDKGLRSNRMGDECEAIVRFPWLFTRYPFPILINSACLKLSEVFRNGSNFSRLLILKVIQESEKHLDKILNVDEFVRRIFSVTYSNDPIARAITLRTLGSIASIVSERKNIHHCIRSRLDSSDEVEAIAAVEASAAFAKKSVDFAINICPKVLTMLSLPTTSLETKINLLSVLHHTHYDTAIAFEIRQRLIQYLPSNPPEKFICAILHTLTYISSSSLIQIPEQIQLLIRYYINSTSTDVKMTVLLELQVLAASTHMWVTDNVKDLLGCLNYNDGNYKILSRIACILVELVKCPCLLAGEPEYLEQFENKVVEFCVKVIDSDYGSVHLVSLCFQLLTELSGRSEAIKGQTLFLLKKFLLSSERITDGSLLKRPNDYRRICKAMATFSNVDVEASETIVGALREILIRETLCIQWLGFIADTLCAINFNASSVDFSEDVFNVLTRVAAKDCDEEVITKLFVLYFRALAHFKRQCPSTSITVLSNNSHWLCYRIIRQAMRYGHHTASRALCECLLNTAPSENVHFWIIALHKICKAEGHLADAQANKIAESSIMTAISSYVEGISALKAAVTPSNPLTFPCEYAAFRCKLLQTHMLLRQSCRLIKTAPAPAIASSAALNTRDDLMKCGLIVTQMRKCAKEFRSLADGYSSLYQMSFNADNETLSHVQLLQQSCTIFAEAIESVFQTNRLSALFVNKDTQLQSDRRDYAIDTPPEHKRLIAVCHHISRTVREELNSKSLTNGSGVNGAHISTLLSMSQQLLSVPLCVPRFFFQPVQNTCIKLAISPQPKSPNDLLTTFSNNNFGLKVEGVLVNADGGKIIRKVAKIMLSVTSSLFTKAGNNDQLLKPVNDSSIHLNSYVVPRNDYFQAQFLLPLVVPGVHTISVEAYVIDDNDAQWKTGPVASVSAKVIEEKN